MGRNKKTVEQLIDEAKLHWRTPEELFDYSKVNYVNAIQPVEIICRKHNMSFHCEFRNHVSGCVSCPFCIKEQKAQTFINKARNIHGDRFNYDYIEYINVRIPLFIFCNEHQRFFSETPNNHIHTTTKSCHCSGGDLNTRKENFIQNAMKRHNGKYNYGLVEYVSNSVHVKIICPIHGVFEQKPNNHISGHECKQCGIAKKKALL